MSIRDSQLWTLEEHVDHDVDAPGRVGGAGDDVPPRPGHEEDVARAQDHAEGLGLKVAR